MSVMWRLSDMVEEKLNAILGGGPERGRSSRAQEQK